MRERLHGVRRLRRAVSDPPAPPTLFASSLAETIQRLELERDVARELKIIAEQLEQLELLALANDLRRLALKLL